MAGSLKAALESSVSAFLVVSATARTSPEGIPLRGYAGPSGRLDVVARAFEAVVERDSLALALLLGPPNPPLLVAASWECRAGLGGERGFVRAFAEAFRGRGCLQLYPGVSLRDLLSMASRRMRVVLLSEGGVDVGSREALEALCSRALFILGSHVDMPQAEEEVARSYADAVVSVGPLSYHTEHVIAFIETLRMSGACRLGGAGSR